MKGPLSPFQQGLKLVSYCPLCEHKYDVTSAKIIDEREDAQLLHITCNTCSASVLAVILMNHVGVTSVGLVSDLNTHEVLKFKDLKPIADDELLDLHTFLETNEPQELLKKFNIG